MRILKDSEGNLAKANIISSLPEEFEDITDIIVNPEKLDEVALEYLSLQTVAAIEEVQAQPAFWSNGVDTVYDSEDIPTVEDEEGNAILDPEYVKTPAVEYVAPEPQKYRLVKKNGTDQAIAQKQVEVIIRSAIAFGAELLVQFSTENVLLGITQAGKTKEVRQAMSEIITALQTGSLYDAMDEIDQIPESAKDGIFITDERLQEYKTKIQEYLGA